MSHLFASTDLQTTAEQSLASIAPRRVLVLGATGTIGQAAVQALLRNGHEVVCFIRPRASQRAVGLHANSHHFLAGATVRLVNVCDTASLTNDGFCGEHFDVMVSCLASRTGAPADAWAIDHQAHVLALAAAKAAGVTQVVLLSAICVQKPLLPFQEAKLAFERVLAESGMVYSIVRATAFFKSLSGQIDRLKAGKPFLIFGDGTLTACKPISDGDLGNYLADCIHDASRHNRVLPIGGPGPAISPRQQAEALFFLLNKPVRFRRVPVALLDAIIAVLGVVGRVHPAVAAKAELARIGRYYATESMLVWDMEARRYDADATPSTGTETLADFYGRLLRGEVSAELGDHKVF